MKMLATLMLLVSVNAQAIDRLTPAQLAGETAFIALMVADYKQTQQITHFCDTRAPDCTIHETNRLLGRAPSHSKVRNYFVSAAVMHVAVMALLPSDTRAAWIASGITVEAVVVGKNKRLGLHVNF